MFRSFLFVFATLLFAACGSKAELSFESPDKTTQLTLQGKKSSSLDPWIIDLKAKSPTAEKTFNLEFYQSELTTENVQVEWSGNSEATLIMKGQDDFVNHFIIQFNDAEISIIKE